MIRLEVDQENDKQLVVESRDFEVDLVKRLPGARFQKTKTVVPKSWPTWVQAHMILKDQLLVGPEFQSWAAQEYNSRVRPSLELRSALAVESGDQFSGMELPYEPRPHQIVDATWMALSQRVLLGNEMGTGKTFSSLLTLRRLEQFGIDPFPVLVVCPNSIKHQWAGEIAACFPRASVQIVGGTATQRKKALEPGADFYVIHWEALELHSRLAPFGSIHLKKCPEHKGGSDQVKPGRCQVCEKELNTLGFQTIIVDEAHKAKNAKANRTRALWAVAHKCRTRIAMTGTPIANSPEDLWSLLHTIEPTEFPTKSAFVERYCDRRFNFFSGHYSMEGLLPATKDEFYQIFDPRYRRVSKEKVLTSLPPVQFSTRHAPMAPKQAKAYKEIKAQMFTRDEDDELILTTNDLTKNTRLVQFASAMCSVEDDHVVMTDAKPKVNVLLDFLEETDGLTVVAAESKQLVDLVGEKLTKEGYRVDYIVGGMTTDQRMNVMRDFDSGDLDVLLFTMQAGGEGLNMTKANNLVFLQSSWNMVLNRQTLGRVLRLGSEQHDSINVCFIVAPDTIEELQQRVVREKIGRLEEIHRDAE